jgi:hypothetical protein
MSARRVVAMAQSWALAHVGQTGIANTGLDGRPAARFRQVSVARIADSLAKSLDNRTYVC